MDDVISRTIAWARPSDGDNLTGFIIDADHAFESTGMFDSVRIERTGDPRRLVVISLVARAAVPTLQDISGALRDAWSGLAYLGFQAVGIERFQDATVMTFVTATEDGGLCVTGEATATSPRYGQLVRDFEDRLSFAGRIKSRRSNATGQ